MILMLTASNLYVRAKLKYGEPVYPSPVTQIMTPGGLHLIRVGFIKLFFS